MDNRKSSVGRNSPLAKQSAKGSGNAKESAKGSVKGSTKGSVVSNKQSPPGKLESKRGSMTSLKSENKKESP